MNVWFRTQTLKTDSFNNELIMKKTLVIGASENPQRYSNMAVHKLLAYNHPVVAIGSRKGMIEDVVIETEKIQFEDIHTITLYLNPARQVEYYQYMIALKPLRIIFNPGTENIDFYILAKENNIEVCEACTLVLLSTGLY